MMKFKIFSIGILFLCPTLTWAQMTIEHATDRNQWRLKGHVKSVAESHWDEMGTLLGRVDLQFSRGGRLLEEIIRFGSQDVDIAECRMYDYNADGSIDGYFQLKRGGENHSVIEQFAHWILLRDKKGNPQRKTAFEIQERRDRYGNPVWIRSREELFAEKNGINDTLFIIDKRTGRVSELQWNTEYGTIFIQP